MAADARSHVVPAATDHPARATLLNLSLSIRDLTVVANTTARTALVSALASAGQTVSTSNPIFIYRTDSGTIELSVDGTNWTVVPDRLDAIYTPVWGSTGTAPGLGNGTLVGDYSQDDRYVDFECFLTLGSTSTVGTGSYSLTAPVAAASALGTTRTTFDGIYTDASTGNIYPFYGQLIAGSSTINLLSVAGPVGTFSATAPVVPASGDTYFVHGRYRWA